MNGLGKRDAGNPHVQLDEGSEPAVIGDASQTVGSGLLSYTTIIELAEPLAGRLGCFGSLDSGRSNEITKMLPVEFQLAVTVFAPSNQDSISQHRIVRPQRVYVWIIHEERGGTEIRRGCRHHWPFGEDSFWDRRAI